MSANYIARQLDYNMTEGWGQGQTSLEAWFGPEPTFAHRFDELCAEIAKLGFNAIDLYTGHLNPLTASEAMLTAAQAVLTRHGLTVISFAGGLGNTAEEVSRSAEVATKFGATLWGGSAGFLKADRARFTAILREHGLKFGVENHPKEKTSQDLLAVMGEGDEDVIGAAIDTGWFATNGFSNPQAIRDVSARVFYVHLKDILKPDASNPGKTLQSIGHETCALGEGVVGIEDCLSALGEIGYEGSLSIEHEPEFHNPNDDLRTSLERVRQWLS